MSTLLIDTAGGDEGSTFRGGEQSNIINSETPLGDGLNSALCKFKISLTNIDSKPELRSTRKVIDVVNDFSWYAGPKATKEALAKVPCVFLTEREQLLSSLISGALYYLNASAGAVKALGDSKFIKSALGQMSESSAKLAKAAGTAGAAASNFLDAFTNLTDGTESDQKLLERHNLKSLAGIYFTTPTGFNYRLPIYSSPSTNTGEWGGATDVGGPIIKTLIEAGTDIVDNISNTVNFAQPGVYIEKPKYFQDVKGREESITFPLVNTVRRGTHSPIQQNYELLWLLAFQNKPYKTSFARTPPPKIYTVSVPGQFSMPYAYISSMEVKFMGTVRQATVFVPSGSGEGVIGSKKITTPVPEAYQVTLKFTSLIGDYGNAMISDAFSTAITGERVTVGNTNTPSGVSNTEPGVPEPS
jgi:hypothetical protein